MRQFNHLYSYHVIYIERWEHGTEGIGLNLNPRWRLQLMSYSWLSYKGCRVLDHVDTQSFSAIRDLAARGYNLRYYDENFRYLRQKEPKAYSWGSVHWELWIRSQPPRHTFSQMNSVKKIEGESKSSFRVPKGYCWKYHKGFRCVECNYKHSCPLCQKGHQMLKCNNFRPSNGKPLAANSATSNTSKGKPT